MKFFVGLTLVALFKCFAFGINICNESLADIARANLYPDSTMTYFSIDFKSSSPKRMLLLPTRLNSDDYDYSLGRNFMLSLTNNKFNSFNVKEINCSYQYGDKFGNLRQKQLHSIRFTWLENNLTYELILNASAITELKLNANHLTQINGFDFYLFLSLIKLDLSRNKLGYLKANAFYGLNKLNLLDLRFNAILIVESFAFNGIKVNEIDFYSSKGLLIDEFAFMNSSLIVSLKIENVNVIDPKNSSLDGLTSLQKLTISFDNNRINSETRKLKRINSNMFDSFRSCLQLILINQNIEILEPFSFNNLTKLSVIDLSGNPLRIISSNAFYNLDGLVDIKFNDLKSIEIIESHSFIGLNKYTENLALSEKNISALNSFSFIGFNRLKELSLSRNCISKIHRNAFHGLKSLVTLLLSNNNLSIIEANTFSNLDSLKTVGLSENPIKLIESYAFDKLNAIETIDLKKTNIQMIQSFAFNDLNNLDVLVIEWTDLSFIGKNIVGQNLSNLTRLNLKNNKFNELPCECFESFENITHFFIGYNAIKRIVPFCFKNLRNLLEIGLDNNLIEAIEENSFHGLNKLEHLQLYDNPIRLIQDYSFSSLVNLGKLNFSPEKIKYLSRNSLTGLKQITSLYFKNGALEEIESFAFNRLENAKDIYLGRNRIQKLKNFTFANSFSLKIIDLFRNKLEIIESHAFYNLSNLELIDLRRNPIRSINTFAFYSLKVSAEIRLEEMFLSDPADSSDIFVDQFDEFKRINHLFKLKSFLHLTFYRSVQIKNSKFNETNCQLTLKLLRESRVLVYQLANDKDFSTFMSKCDLI